MRCYLFTSSCSLAVLAFVTLFSQGLVVTADEPGKIAVGVYYESLCSDSLRWIRDQLLPTYGVLKDHLTVTFVPYGKATQWRHAETGLWQFTCQHGSAECRYNMAHACGIHVTMNEEPAEKIQDLTVALVGCAMTSHSQKPVQQCAEKVGASEKTQRIIDECIGSPLASELLGDYGNQTAALNPPLTFVPTITINGINPENQREILNNFFKYICGKLPDATKPSECKVSCELNKCYNEKNIHEGEG